jgi:hypothetical protein
MPVTHKAMDHLARTLHGCHVRRCALRTSHPGCSCCRVGMRRGWQHCWWGEHACWEEVRKWWERARGCCSQQQLQSACCRACSGTSRCGSPLHVCVYYIYSPRSASMSTSEDLFIVTEAVWCVHPPACAYPALLPTHMHVCADYHGLSLRLAVTPLPEHKNHTSAAAVQLLTLTQEFTAVLRLQPASAALLARKGQLTVADVVAPQADLTPAVCPAATSPAAQRVPAECSSITGRSSSVHDSSHFPSSSGSAPCPPHYHAHQRVSLADVPVSGDGAHQLQLAGVGVRPLGEPCGLPCHQPHTAVRVHAALTGRGLYQGLLRLTIHQLRPQAVAPASQWPSAQQPWAGLGGKPRDSSNSWGGGGVVCVEQWVPWVLRVWLHTLELNIQEHEVGGKCMVWSAAACSLLYCSLPHGLASMCVCKACIDTCAPACGLRNRLLLQLHHHSCSSGSVSHLHATASARC